MTSTSHRFGRFEVRPAQRSLQIDGRPAPLGARAFDMLVVLIERRDRVVSGDELFELVWPGLVVEENNLRQQVAALRKLLGTEAVVTVPGRGYRFGLPLDADATTGPAAAGAAEPMLNNLPLNLAPLIGREAELATVIALQAGTHLLTLVGAGGVGKTRFALEVAATVQADYRDGVWFVELAPLTDPALVPRTVASVLGVHEEPGRPLLDTLLDLLRRREMLLVLDNCEHLIDACARFAEKVQRGSARTRILATSREALGIEGETAWRLPSLRAATPDVDLSIEQLLDYPATHLFVQRAGDAAAAGFRLCADNAQAVAQICHQLDGIPLALELAAARVKSMGVEQLVDRLGDRFALLTRGSRTALQRHQTLRSLIDWSHDLLSEPERVLLRRLAVFAGGWTLDAAEAVCSSAPLAASDVLDLLARLVEKSLVGLDDSAAEPRYRMLETIRQYGAEKLVAAGEADALRSRHLMQGVTFAESLCVPIFVNDSDRRWRARADAELDNLRQAVAWSLESGQPQLGLRLVNQLQRFWYQNMHWNEIVDWIERLGERSDHDGLPTTTERAHAFHVAGMLATNYDPVAGRRLCEAGLAASESIGYDEGMAYSLAWIAYIDSRQGDPATAALFERSLRLGRSIEDSVRRGIQVILCLTCYASYEALMGRDDKVDALVRECEAECAKLGGVYLHLGHCRSLQGTMATRRGDFERAGRLLAESLDLYRAVDSKFDIANSLAQQGSLALRLGDPASAVQLFRESLPLHRNYPMSPWVTKGLANLLIAYAACGRWTVTARLAGVLGGDDRPVLSGRAAQAYAEAVAAARSALGDSVFIEEASAGTRMTREQAIELALAE